MLINYKIGFYLTADFAVMTYVILSFLRHCLLNCGAVLTESLWWLAAQSLRRAFDLTLYPLRQLMMPFHENSDNFYGDVGQVKVAVRQDSTPAESARLRQLAQQVWSHCNQVIVPRVRNLSYKESASISMIQPASRYCYFLCNL